MVKSIGADALYPPAPPSVLSRIKEHLTDGTPSGHEEAAIEALLKNLSGGVSGKSGLIMLEFHHKNAEMAARVVNELTNRYLDRYAGMRRNLRAEGFVQDQLRVLKGELDHASTELETFKVAHQITGSAKDDQDLALHQLSLAQTEANEISNREAELHSRIESLRGQVAKARRELAENDASSGNGATMSITSLRERLSVLQLREAEMSESYTAEYPPLQSIRSEIQSLHARLASLETRTGSAAPPMDEATYRFLREELLRNESELTSLKAKRASQAPQINAIRGKVNEMDRVQGEYSRLQQQVQVAQDNYKQYLASAEQTRIGRAMDEEKISDLRVVEPARVPNRPERSKAPLVVALAAFLGLVGGIGIALVTEMTRGTLDTVEEVEDCLQVPVLSSVPAFPGGRAGARST